MEILLRRVEPNDLPVFFDHQRDPAATALAAVPARDRDAFDAHWARILADPTVITRTVVAAGAVAGNVVSWEDEGQRFVGYWIGRELWGRGVATRALAAFLGDVAHRPLYADVAPANVGSLRVLEKCGFSRRSTTDDGVALVLLG